MEGSFIPECYFDTVLVKTILQLKDVINHQKGCNNVMKKMKDGNLNDRFAVGIVDNDNAVLNYFKEFNKYEFDKFNLFEHKIKPQFVIQLNPPLEKWLLEVAKEAKISVEDFGLPTDIEKLKKLTKSELADETKELKELCKALVNSNSVTIKRLSHWIQYLKKKNYQADIKVLINA